jgi:TonB family protein
MRILLMVVMITATCVAQEKHKIGVAKYEFPVYPRIAKAARAIGPVVMHLSLTADGQAQSVTVTSGHAILLQPATEAIRKWRFTCLSCKPGETYEHTVTFIFALDPDWVGEGRRYKLSFPDSLEITHGQPEVHH